MCEFGGHPLRSRVSLLSLWPMEDDAGVSKISEIAGSDLHRLE
jgi:hypothetical protein